MGYTQALSAVGERIDNYNYGIYHNWGEITRRYQADGLFRLIVDSPVEQAFKKGFEIHTADTQTAQRITERLNELGYVKKFSKAAKWARLYGGAVIVVTADDTDDISNPLEIAEVTRIADIEVYERPCVSFGGVNPEQLNITSIRGSFTVHISRCLIFRNGELPQFYADYYDLFFGEPEYSRIKPYLDAVLRLNNAIPQLFENSIQYVYKVAGLAAKMETDDGEAALMRRLGAIRQGRTLFGMAAIDADGEDMQLQTYTLSGHSEMADCEFNLLSAVTEIPQTILFGRSPSGMNATGEADFESYYNLIERLQEQIIMPPLTQFVDLIVAELTNRGEFKEEKFYGLDIEKLPLKNMSEEQQAQIANTTAQAEQTRANTANIYLQMGVLTEDEIRKGLADKGDFDIETLLDDMEDLGEVDEPVFFAKAVEKDLTFRGVCGKIDEAENSEDEQPRDKNGRFTKGGKAVTDKRNEPHFSIPAKANPNEIIDTKSGRKRKNGGQTDRTYYDDTGSMHKQIHGGDHGNPKQHAFGKKGEHGHDYADQALTGIKKKQSGRKLTDTEEIDNEDLFNDG